MLRDEILMEAESNSSLSQDSLASLTAGDVLIHSTGVHREKPFDAATEAGDRMKKVTIAVKKLREAVSPRQAADAASAGGGTVCVPPALLVNRAPCGGGVTHGTLRSAAPGA